MIDKYGERKVNMQTLPENDNNNKTNKSSAKQFLGARLYVSKK